MFNVFSGWHNHTDYSNYSHRDSIITPEELIDTAIELGHTGVGITDHAVLSGHVKAIVYLEKLKKEAEKKALENPEDENIIKKYNQIKNFKLGLGCEIYLVNKEVVDSAREKNESTKFFHLITIPKNIRGYRKLCDITSRAWENSFYHRGVERVPLYKEDLIELLDNKEDDFIVSSACLGSEFSQLVLEYLRYPKKESQEKIVDYLNFMVGLFGDNYYIEIQPSHFEEQIEYNKFALKLADFYDIKTIITTDSHFLKPEYSLAHERFLKSQNAERETKDFYSSTYMMNTKDLYEYFKEYLTIEEFNCLLINTQEIHSKIEDIDLHQNTQVPDATIEFDENFKGSFQYIKSLCINYPYIYKYLTSDHMIDRIILQQLEKGFIEKKQEYNHENLTRLNEELESMWEVSKGLGQRLSSYYVLTKEIVELMWTVSLVGVSRGSAGSFYCSYLLSITTINPSKSAYDLPHWRHL